MNSQGDDCSRSQRSRRSTRFIQFTQSFRQLIAMRPECRLQRKKVCILGLDANSVWRILNLNS